MTNVLVTTNLNPKLYVDVNLKSDEWSSLHIDNLPSFKMEERKQPCSVYKDGVFPGGFSRETGPDKQYSRIRKFENYIEFCKVVSDEVVPILGQLYLTTLFYDRRKDGWASDTIKKKSGEVLGYCINGDIYSAEDKEEANKVFYGIAYRALISGMPEFARLQKCILGGICLILNGGDKELLDNLADILLKSVEDTSEL